jgi:hypothetical protein
LANFINNSSTIEDWTEPIEDPIPLSRVRLTELMSTIQFKKLGLSQIKMQYRDFIKERLRIRARQYILTPIRAEMRKNKVSNKIIMNTNLAPIKLIGNKKFRIEIISEYMVDGFDVALAREKGTKDHWIEPAGQSQAVKKKALHWVQNGQNRFSKGHMVSGMPRLMTIRNTLNSNKHLVRRAVKRDLKLWMKQIMKTT